MKTIAFITRVHPKRPEMLKVCRKSVKAQTDNDYIHIIHRHDKTEDGYGGVAANRSLKYVRPIYARYVMVLDDDDMLVEPDFVKIFKGIVDKDNPEIVFFKGIVLGNKTFPTEQTWRKFPSRGSIASFCFAVRRDIWKKYISYFGGRGRRGGDFYFLSYCYRGTKDHIWLDHIVAQTQKKAGKAKGEHEHA